MGLAALGHSYGYGFQAMSSVCEIRLDGDNEPALADAARQATSQATSAAISEAISEVRRIETKYSRYRPDSIVSRINAAAGSGTALAVDDETAGLLDFAAHLHALSDGLFDITSGVLRRAWDFRAAVVPDSARLHALLPLLGWPLVRWREHRIELPRAGMEIDFGGFGKEYAADRAATLLQQHGVAHGMVNLGGDIRLVGPRPGGAVWSLGIQHPRDAKRMLATLMLGTGALATSGDYERYFELDGVRYCHLLNPRTGRPVNAWRSVSVVAPACLAAGALTTVAMLKGGDALAFLAAQNVAYLAVDAAGGVHHHAAEVVWA